MNIDYLVVLLVLALSIALALPLIFKAFTTRVELVSLEDVYRIREELNKHKRTDLPQKARAILDPQPAVLKIGGREYRVFRVVICWSVGGYRYDIDTLRELWSLWGNGTHLGVRSNLKIVASSGLLVVEYFNSTRSGAISYVRPKVFERVIYVSEITIRMGNVSTSYTGYTRVVLREYRIYP